MEIHCQKGHESLDHPRGMDHWQRNTERSLEDSLGRTPRGEKAVKGENVRNTACMHAHLYNLHTPCIVLSFIHTAEACKKYRTYAIIVDIIMV